MITRKFKFSRENIETHEISYVEYIAMGETENDCELNFFKKINEMNQQSYFWKYWFGEVA